MSSKKKRQIIQERDFEEKDIVDAEPKVRPKKKRAPKSNKPKKRKEDVVSKKQEAPKKRKAVKKKRQTAHEEDIQDQLVHIYQNDDGSLPDMSQFIVKKRNRLLRALATLVIAAGVLGGAAWFGFFVYQPQASFSEESVVLSISGEEEISLGERMRYRIRYRNAQQVPLNNAVLEVRYPDGFVFEESSLPPISENNDQWNLGDLARQESGFIDVFGTFYGDIDSEQSFRLFLNYTPANFNGDFQKVATQAVTLAESPITLVVEQADNVVSGVEVPIAIRLTNDAVTDIGPIKVIVEPGKGFTKTRSEPESDDFDSFEWTVERLPAKADTLITLYGSFSGEAQATANVIVEGEQQIDEEAVRFAYATAKYEAAVSEQGTSLQTIINGASGDFAVQPGEKLNVRVTARNNGDTPITNGRVRVIFDSPSYQNRSLMNWTELELVSPDDGVVIGEQMSESIRRGIMSFDLRHAPALRSLGAGEEVTIDFRLPIQSADNTTLANFEAYTIQLSTELQFDLGGEQKIVTTNPTVMTINSDLQLAVDDVIANDGGTHTITWLLTNSFHELKDLTISADIFGDTVLDEEALSVPAGEVIYDKDKNNIMWKIDALPLELESAPLVFTLLRNTVDTTQTQLMSKIRIEATDTETGQVIRLVGDEILLETEEE